MIFFDLHTDIPLTVKNGEKSAVLIKEHTFEQLLLFAAFWLDEKASFSDYLNIKKKFKEYLNQKGLNEKTNFSNLNKTNVFLSVENAGFLADDINIIYKLKKDNIKAISLTWNGENSLAGGAYSSGGLKPKGKEVILKANELSLFVDISHLNNTSAIDTIKLANKVYASHSCCYEVHKHCRNLKPEVLKLLKEKNGIFGLCFYPEFLGGNNVFEKLYQNIVYLLEKNMQNNIALGSDFDGAKMNESLSNSADVFGLYKYLLNKGIDKKILEKIFYKNAVNFFQE